MAYEYDRFEREDGGGSFLMGLLAGTVLGAGLGMLFAPKAGSDLRNQFTEQAGRLRTTASDAYSQATEKVSQATEKVSQMVDRGREAYDRARTSGGFTGGSQGGSTDGGTVGAASGVGGGTGGYGSDRG
jgi:YtxH-like protein